MGIEDAIPVVGWGLFRLPKEKRRLEELEAQAREMFGTARDATTERTQKAEDAPAPEEAVVSRALEQTSRQAGLITHHPHLSSTFDSSFLRNFDDGDDPARLIHYLGLASGRGYLEPSSTFLESIVGSTSSVVVEGRRSASTTSRSAERAS